MKGLELKTSPEIGSQCAHPYCSETRNLEKHHLWRRSFLGGAFDWVELWDGTVVANVVYLCRKHHLQVTENKVSVEWDLARGFYWVDDNSSINRHLYPHPQIIVSDSKHERHEDEPDPYRHAGSALGGLTESSGNAYVVSGHEAFGVPMIRPPLPGEECRLCERKVPEKKKREPAKKRTTLTFRVPKDAQEDGAEVLSELIVEVEKVLRPGEEPRPGYYTICDGLGLFLLNKETIL